MADLPTNLINTIKSLYTNATMCVILNGHPSEKFMVGRGVCQDNPLSCLLFNFAIKPLSRLIRTSGHLKGLQITTPTSTHQTLLSLFTNDAAVFITEEDSPPVLFKILDEWCLTSSVGGIMVL